MPEPTQQQTPRVWTLGTEVLSDSGQQFDVICAGPTLGRDEGVVVVEAKPVAALLERMIDKDSLKIDTQIAAEAFLRTLRGSP